MLKSPFISMGPVDLSCQKYQYFSNYTILEIHIIINSLQCIIQCIQFNSPSHPVTSHFMHKQGIKYWRQLGKKYLILMPSKCPAIVYLISLSLLFSLFPSLSGLQGTFLWLISSINSINNNIYSCWQCELKVTAAKLR